MRYTVQKLARLAGISVRTLHHYDQIRLLKPSTVERNGYRYYEEMELLRLQQILFFRELDFPLLEIKEILDRKGLDKAKVFEDQKKLLELKRARLDGLISSICTTIKNMNTDSKSSDKELYDAFKDDDVKQYQDEVKARWGNTDAYTQSQAKVSKMTKAEMDKLKEEGKKFTQKLADSMNLPIESDEVQALVAQHHKGIEFFYPCSTEMYRNLGKMYVDDPRFTAYYDKFAPGLAVFLRDAIAYFCDVRERKA